MNSDPEKTSLPLQIIGFVLLLVGSVLKNWLVSDVGLALHFAGDVWFFFQLKEMGFY